MASRQVQANTGQKVMETIFFLASFKFVCVIHADACGLRFRDMCQELSLASVIVCRKSGESSCNEMTLKAAAATDCYHHNESNRKGARLTRK